MNRPLEFLRVLDFSTLLPGPFATMMLADLGADVVRVEAPDRPDWVRMLPPFDGDVSAWHALLNRNKRSLAIDLKQPGAIEVIHRLVQTYDIVVEQFRPGVMDRLGIGYASLSADQPATDLLRDHRIRPERALPRPRRPRHQLPGAGRRHEPHGQEG